MATTSSLDALKLYADSFRFASVSSNNATAYQLLRQAITLDPEFALAHAELGRRYYLENSRADRLLGEDHFTKAEHEPAVAVKLFEAALVPRFDADILESLAVARAAAGQPEAAAQAYEQLLLRPELGLESQEHWFASHVALGELWHRLGRGEDARRLSSQLVELWKGGDADLVALRRAKQPLAAR
jgi:tetratricopeptide (TPR) repeat protein